MLDHDGSGAEKIPAQKLEADLQNQLDVNGWKGRSTVIVLEPEIEAWVWTPARSVDRILGWNGRLPGLREWLYERNFTEELTAKPKDPKAAFEAALKHVGKRTSASLFSQLAKQVSFSDCEDRAFQKLSNYLKQWFPEHRSVETSS